jgi:hypothetical protein
VSSFFPFLKPFSFHALRSSYIPSPKLQSRLQPSTCELCFLSP